MKLKEIGVTSYEVTGENLSGETLSEWVNSGRKIYGRIAPGTSVENFGSSRNDVTDGITVYVEGIVDSLTSRDRLVIDSESWEIVGSPARWENTRGYRSVTVVTARKVEG